MMKEIWKQHPRYEQFEISSLGRVKRVAGTVRFLTKKGEEAFRNRKAVYRRIHVNKNRGYAYCNLTGKTETIHRLVAETFLPDFDKSKDVDHINGVRTDNRVQNLRMCTRKENINNPVTKVYCLTRQRDSKGLFI